MTLEEMLRKEREEGIMEGRKLVILQMVSEKEISAEKGAEKLGISSEEFRKKLEKYLTTKE